MYNRGYPIRLSRDRHIITHERECKFLHPDCLDSKQSSHTQAALKSHERAGQPQDDLLPEYRNVEGFTSTSLSELGDDDLALVLKDAIIYSDADTIRTLLGFRPDLTQVLEDNFHKQESTSYKRYGRSDAPFGYCLCLAAWNSTLETLRLLVEHNSDDTFVLHALATAIETKNRTNIEYLLSFSPSLNRNDKIPRHFERIILNKQRSGAGNSTWYIAKDIVSRALSLWDPELMDFLTNECNLVISRVQCPPGGLFSRPAIRDLSLEQVRDRFERMRKYLTHPRAFDDGVCRAVISRSLSALKICLQNHGNPDATFEMSSSKTNAMGQAYFTGTKLGKEMLRLLLEHGANPVPRNFKGETIQARLLDFTVGMPWDEFVKKARSGEDLEMILP